jgi:hypothetical protein
LNEACWFCKHGKHDDCLRLDHDGNLIPNTEEDCSCQTCFGLRRTNP